MKRGAFTLVELIVVITILAILGTIGFISLQGYSSEARDSKRISDINNINKKISLEVTKGTSISELVTVTNTGIVTINSQSGTRNQGVVNFTKLKENRDDFTDNGIDYPISYSIGGTGTGRYNFLQLATIKESTNQAVLAGNYYKIQSGDSESIILNGNGQIVTDNGNVLPYNNNDSNLPVGGIITTFVGNGINGINGINYRVHIFNNTLTTEYFDTKGNTLQNVDYLIIGGGGAGGNGEYGGGGGGGAGGLIYKTGASIISGNYPIIIGTGGLGTLGTYSASPSGGNTVALGYIAVGGGGGGSGGAGSFSNGRDGGNGGGGTVTFPGVPTVDITASGGLSIFTSPSIGYSGGGSIRIANSGVGARSGGGGGGAGGVGGNGYGSNSNTYGGNGGIGFQSSITGNTIYYSGGGGGGTRGWSNVGLGGLGGGGNGNSNGSGNNANYYGGGGGGAGNISINSGKGGDGYQGVVIIKYSL